MIIQRLQTQWLPLLVLGLLVVNIVLGAWFQFVALSQLTALAVGAALLGGLLFPLVSIRRNSLLWRALLLFMAGSAGLLIGCAIDFGQPGWYVLSSICKAPSAPNEILTRFASLLSLAPSTHIAMLLACSLALLTTDYRPSLKNLHCLPTLALHLKCLLGMLAGIWVAEILVNYVGASWFPALREISMLMMWLGMGVGTVTAYLFSHRQSAAKIVRISR